MSLNFGQSLFPPRRELITSYNWIDTADGTGYISYYGGLGSNGTTFVTNSATINSEKIKTATAGTVGSSTEFFDKFFDINFSTPKNIKGNVYISVPIGAGTINATAYDVLSLSITATISHYDGSTTTQLDTGSSISYTIDNLDKDILKSTAFMANIILNVATTTHFKAGETFRIRIQAFNEVQNVAIFVGVGHDPANRTDYDELGNATPRAIFSSKYSAADTTTTFTTQPTRMTFQVPFKLDL